MQCRMDDTGAIANYDPSGPWHPSVGYASPGHGPIAIPVVRKPYPEPEVTSRMGIQGPERKAVTDLVRLAGKFGWFAQVTYARGCFPHASQGTPGPVKDSLAVRLSRNGVRAVAVYAGADTWAWDTLALQDRSLWPRRLPSLTEFMDGVFGPLHEPIKADRPMEGPARRALKTWGPLLP